MMVDMKKKLALTGTMFFFLIFLVPSVYAIPSCAFGGSVTDIDGNPVAGAEVKAYLQGTEELVASGLTTVDGYGIAIENTDEKYVIFKVSDKVVDQDPQYCDGEGLFTPLDLTVTDLDDDNYGQGEDCNDTDSNINPGALEICGNEIDDDCDEAVDEEPCCGNEKCETDEDNNNCPGDCKTSPPVTTTIHRNGGGGGGGGGDSIGVTTTTVPTTTTVSTIEEEEVTAMQGKETDVETTIPTPTEITTDTQTSGITGSFLTTIASLGYWWILIIIIVLVIAALFLNKKHRQTQDIKAGKDILSLPPLI